MLTPEEAKALAGLSPAEQAKSGLSIAIKASPHCEQPGRDVIDPDTSSRQLILLREQLAVTLKSIAIREEATLAEQECVMKQARQLSDAQMVQLANGRFEIQEGLLLELFERCT